MNNQGQANTNDPLGIIGKKMKGFKFNDATSQLSFAHGMERLIGVEGEVLCYIKENNSYKCEFPNAAWHYPAELIKDHLVDTPQELTILDKFEQGWEIKYKDGVKAIEVYKSKTWHDRIILEWADGTSSCGNDIDFEGYITCTPPKERKTLYLYERDEKTSFCVTTVKFPECGIITEIHLEKNGDNWEVVNP